MIRRDSRYLGRELTAYLERNQLSQEGFVREFNKENQSPMISQPWLSRVLNGKVKRLTPRVIDVMSYANIPVYKQEVDGEDEGRLLIEQALSEVWDGSANDALGISEILRACRGLMRSAK